MSIKFPRKSWDDVMDNRVYDDAWLREVLSLMREDLQQHREDDKAAHAELHACIDAVRHDVHELKETLHALVLVGKAARWIVYIIAGAGGLAALGKVVAAWFGKS